MTEEGVLLAKLEDLDRSRRGYVSTLTRLCNEIENNLTDFANVTRVKNLQEKLQSAWIEYKACVKKYDDLISETSKNEEISTQFMIQRERLDSYNERIELFVARACTFYNEQVNQEIRQSERQSPPMSVKSSRSHVSRLSACSSRARDARAAAAKAELERNQAEERCRKMLEIEQQQMELEFQQHQIEMKHRYTLTKLRTECELQGVKDKAEMARLEADLAERDMDELSTTKAVDQPIATTAVPVIVSQAISTTISPQHIQTSSQQSNVMTVGDRQSVYAPTTQSVPPGVVPLSAPVSNTILPTYREHQGVNVEVLPVGSLQTSSVTNVISSSSPTITSVTGSVKQPYTSTPLPASIPDTTASLQQRANLVSSTSNVRISEYNPSCSPVQLTTPSVRAENVFPHVSFQVPTPEVLERGGNVRHNYSTTQPEPLPPIIGATNATSNTETIQPTVTTQSEQTPPGVGAITANSSLQTKLTATPRVADHMRVDNESIMSTIASGIANISLTQDLPKVQVQRFDGSPEKFPTFRQRFRQMVESRALDDSVKMTLLLQFLEGPALRAVQRYEALPGGLTNALQTLEDRFGRPSQVVRACVDALTKGPAIQSSDKQAIQQLADDTQVAYETLRTLGYLGEMNTDNLERIIARLPKWAQTRFVETVNKKRKNQEMPNFKDVVDFLRERAEVMNHPFFSKPPAEATSSRNTRTTNNTERQKERPTSYRVTTLSTTSNQDNSKRELCCMCEKPHRLYRCEQFKTKSPRERNDFVKSRRICFNCLSSTDHTAKACKSSTRCQISGCGKSHHTMLHFTDAKEVKPADGRTPLASPPTTKEATSTINSSATVSDASSEVLLQVIPVTIIADNGKSVTTYGLVDSGSDATLIDPSLVKDLQMKGISKHLSLSTVSDTEVRDQAMNVSFVMSPVNNPDETQVHVETAWAVKELTLPLKHIRIAEEFSCWPHLREIPFPEVQRKKISVLIGTNVQEVFIPLEVRAGKPKEPLAIKSCLGWSVLGRSCHSSASERYFPNHVSAEDQDLNRQLERFWTTESYGTEKCNKESMSVEDRRAVKIIEETKSKVGDHYQMGLLWKDDDPHLPKNRALAEARLQHLKRRFIRDPDLEVKYKAVIEEYLAKGYAKKLTDKEATEKSNFTWYLPHHPVLNPNKPGKVRVVFDAAAKFAGVSLNDMLLQGPSLTNDLTSVLLRFRQHENAFTADVEAMFYQLRVIPKDTDALRFLWWPNGIESTPEVYKMLVHIFGAKSSPCCANMALRTTAEDNKDKYNEGVIETVYNNFYVDDVLKSTPTTDEAVYVATELSNLLSEGGFHLTKFSSNKREVLASIPTEERAKPTLDLNFDRLPVERALGIQWDSNSDNFQFKVVQTEKPLTKRGILSTISSLFDPLGFFSPFVLPIKFLLQDLWRIKLPWDTEIPEPYLTAWRNWIKSLPHIVTMQIPRCFKHPGLGVIVCTQLHLFSDASRRGYAAVSYLRMVDDQGRVHCVFVMGKSKCAPLKELSIPRLELQAAVLATRLHQTIVSDLDVKIDDTRFWTDSMTVLQYILNTNRRFSTFVSNRLTEIHERTLPSQWNFVPGTLNPADEGSRGMDIYSFGPKCRWWTGAIFLKAPEHQWPSATAAETPEDDKEVIKERHVMMATEALGMAEFLKRHSSWPKLLRVTSYILRFVNRARRRRMDYKTSAITLEEMNAARDIVVRIVQRERYSAEMSALASGKHVNTTSKLANLNPVLVDGSLRVGGRIRNAPVPYDSAHPIILPGDHPVSTMILSHYHKTLGHAGREHVMSAVRQHFWIVNSRSIIRRLVRECVTCRKRSAPVITQMMGDLPKERLTPYQPPFTYTGIDFFGPFHVKHGRGTKKVYGCIFVCFNSRAIHVEDVSSLETDTFIQALRRFISVRGCPKEIWSDNGTNFTGAEREIRRSIQQWNESVIKGELHSKNVEWQSCPIAKWRFQPPTASHMSGVWERLIRSVRRSMKGVVGSPTARLSLETLRTVFAEVTSILNSRPLCASSDDPNDLEAITPNHLLLQRQNVNIPPGVFEESDLYSRRHWRCAQFLASCFWKRWLHEYVPTLQSRQKWFVPKRSLTTNDLVLVVDNTTPRSNWLLGRVAKVFAGKDGHVRTVQVKTKNSTLVRPVSKLCLLEEAR